MWEAEFRAGMGSPRESSGTSPLPVLTQRLLCSLSACRFILHLAARVIPEKCSCYAETVEFLNIQLNGRQRSLAELHSPAPLDRLIAVLELKADRIAVEHNGEIVPRAVW